MVQHEPTGSQTRLSKPTVGVWNDDDYDVLADGNVVGRILKVHAPPVCGRYSCNGGIVPPFHRAVCDQFTPGGLPKLLRLDVGRPDHLAPLLGFFSNELAEVRRRACERIAT